MAKFHGNFEKRSISQKLPVEQQQKEAHLAPPPHHYHHHRHHYHHRGGKSAFVQLLELWSVAKLVLKQDIKAHGPLVIYITWYRKS